MEQGAPRAASFCDYQVTVAEIEERSGLTFWSGLAQEVQEELKAKKGSLPERMGCVESAVVTSG